VFAILLTEGMDPFYQNIASFPTVFFSFFLFVTLLYWFVAVLGFVDIDVLDFEADVNAESTSTTADILAGLFMRLGLNGVPVTIVISFISLIGWILCYYAVHFLFGWLPDGIVRFIAGIPVVAICLYVAAVATAIVIKPLKPFFDKTVQNTPKLVLGQTAIVRTLRVDSDFGEATLEDGGAGLIFKVRTEGGVSFSKGDRVVLLEHIKESNTYLVIAEEEFIG